MLNKEKNKVCLVILDGVGYNKNVLGNAVENAKMKNYEKIKRLGVTTLIKASGLEVGLASDKDNGNSEVGHNAMGAGQYIKQGLSLVNEAIVSGKIFESETYIKAIAQVETNKSNLHFIILLSDGRLHSDINHLFLFLENLKSKKLGTIYIHALLDGRDVAPQSAYKYIKLLQNKIAELKIDAKLASVGGRNVVGMDRYESNCSLIENAFNLWVLGKGKTTKNIENEINEIYSKNKGITDENLPAFTLDKKGVIKAKDSVILLNYRGDRAIEICELFDNFKYVSDAKDKLKNVFFAGITQYDADLNLPKNFLTPPPLIKNTLADCLIKNNLSEFAVTETQKFGHITYYFNGNKKEKQNEDLQTWIEVESDKVIFNKKPKMKAKEITKKLINAIKYKDYDFYKTNLTNGDMVGHTGDLAATVVGLKEVDKCLGKILKTCLKNKVDLIVTADHGNSEEMLDSNGQSKTSHTNNPVFISIISNKKIELRQGTFGLTNIASTICSLLEITPLKEFNEPIIKVLK